jgi:hypothetical protein
LLLLRDDEMSIAPFATGENERTPLLWRVLQFEVGVVTHDGPPPTALLDKLASEFR